MNLLALLPGYRELVRQLEEQQAVTEEARQEIKRLENICDMLKKELHTVEHDAERYIEDNAALKKENEAQTLQIVDLHFKIATLEDDLNVATATAVPARPRAKKKVVEE